MSMTGLSAQLKISVNCVSQSVAKGKILAKMNDYSLAEYKGKKVRASPKPRMPATARLIVPPVW
jgi:hypothetical protein